MKTIEILFWTGLFIIFYAYIGYGVILYIMVMFKRIFNRKKPNIIKNYKDLFPSLTHLQWLLL